MLKVCTRNNPYSLERCEYGDKWIHEETEEVRDQEDG